MIRTMTHYVRPEGAEPSPVMPPPKRSLPRRLVWLLTRIVADKKPPLPPANYIPNGNGEGGRVMPGGGPGGGSR
jgi:hypothetical protein